MAPRSGQWKCVCRLVQDGRLVGGRKNLTLDSISVAGTHASHAWPHCVCSHSPSPRRAHCPPSQLPRFPQELVYQWRYYPLSLSPLYKPHRLERASAAKGISAISIPVFGKDNTEKGQHLPLFLAPFLGRTACSQSLVFCEGKMVSLVSRQGRQLQRYTSCGKRLIVGCVFIFLVLKSFKLF